MPPGVAPHHVSAPVLLAAVVLTVRPGQDDYELQLTEQARINPALVRNLSRAHGIAFDPQTLARLAYSTARFDPAPVLERLRTLMQPIRGAQVEHHLLVSTLCGSFREPLGPGAAVAERADRGPVPGRARRRRCR